MWDLVCARTCVHVLSGSDALDDCTCKAGYTGSTSGACTPCETGKYKPVSGNTECHLCDSGRTSAPGLVPRSACLPTWLHAQGGNYYLNLNEASNWAEYYPSRTNWAKVRFVRPPAPGDTTALVYSVDFTFTSWNGEYSFAHDKTRMPWGRAADCRVGGQESSFSLDLIQTPFQIEGSPSLNWCSETDCLSPIGPGGWMPHGSVTCGLIACSGSVGGRCGYGGIGFTAGQPENENRCTTDFDFDKNEGNCTITLLTRDGPLLGFHPGVLEKRSVP